NLSALYALPFGRNATGFAKAVAAGWEIGGIVNARSGVPIDVRIARADVVYIDGLGNVFANPAADRTAVVNTPGGGNTPGVRRPDLIPGVGPFLVSGALIFHNP